MSRTEGLRRWSGKPAPVHLESTTGMSRLSKPILGESDGSNSKSWRFPDSRSPQKIGPNNPHIYISFKDYSNSNENHDSLQTLLRLRGCGYLKCERRDGYYILFQDTPDGQRFAGDCYRSLLNKRVNGSQLKMKLFASGASVKSQYHGVKARSPDRGGSSGLAVQAIHERDTRDATSAPLVSSEQRRVVPPPAVPMTNLRNSVPNHVDSQNLRPFQPSSPSPASKKQPDAPTLASAYMNGRGNREGRIPDLTSRYCSLIHSCYSSD